jgi:hypothetical protein
MIKTIGDEVMYTFGTAEHATNAACEMQEVLDDEVTEEASADHIALSVSVGIHYGPTILESGDVFGDAVNVAARMTEIAKPRQIITTRDTVDKMSAILQAGTRFIDHAPIKGKKESIDIFEVLWQEEDITHLSTDVVENQHQQQSLLTLRYHDQKMEMNEIENNAMLGRSTTCDMAVKERLASRHHVKIECRRGKFFIVDQSTNGTYIRSSDGDSFLRREESPLTGTGQISLGRAFDDATLQLIQYDVKLAEEES